MSSDIINLNVGGFKYSTTKSTLAKYPQSMLGAMFTHNMPARVDKDGSYFIDRNGEMFQYILEFLRSGDLTLPKKFDKFDLLKQEIDFFQIQPLMGKSLKEKMTNLIIVYYQYQDCNSEYKYIKHYCGSKNEKSFIRLFSQTKLHEEEYSKQKGYIDKYWVLKEKYDVSTCDELVAFITSLDFSSTTASIFYKDLAGVFRYFVGTIFLFKRK